MPIVDSHIHLLPGRLAAKVRAYFEQNLAGELAYPIDHGLVRERLAAEGVTHAWSLPYAHKAGIAEGLNEASAATVAASEGGPLRVIGGATVHPDDGRPDLTIRRAVEDHGLRVAKLHCSVGDYECDDARLDGFWAYVSEHRIPVVIHAGHATTGFTEAAELVTVGLVAERFPDARVIIAHCGHRDVTAALALLAAHANVYADLTPVVREAVAITPELAAPFARKLLFGSDAPNVVRTVSAGLSELDGWPISPGARQAIKADNALRLLDEIR